MVKEDLRKALSLSCVENYFLSYFNDLLDVRILYTESYETLDKAAENFFMKDIKYENYPLKRLQDISEELGLTKHEVFDFFKFRHGGLNLIQVNESFFKKSKLYPWREDHYIAVEKNGAGYKYYNNYPLSEGFLSEKELNDIFAGKSLYFFETRNFLTEQYKNKEKQEYEKIFSKKAQCEFVFDLKGNKETLLKLRDIFLVLKTLRNRTIQWLELESQMKRAELDESFDALSLKTISLYENIVTDIQLRIARGRISTQVLNEKISEIKKTEKLLFKSVRQRR